MKLHLGVVDVPYNVKGGTSTGNVAVYLEDEYRVMGNFVDLHMPEIVELVEISTAEAIEALMAGAPASLNQFSQATQDITKLFHNYLDNEEIAQTGQAGVPTQAAIDGVRTSLKKKKEIKNLARYRSKVRGTRRVSFVDTGLYRKSFKAWTE